MEDKIFIGLVDDHALFRSGIANLLKEYENIVVVFQASNGMELQQLMPSVTRVDVVLMDINMPVMDGFTATRWMKQFHPAVNILALSMFDDDVSIIKMIKNGAGGYILKESQPYELYKAVLEISTRHVFVNELVSGKMMRSLQNNTAEFENEFNLTPRELEFIILCVSEMTYKEIADKMGVAARTVDNYRQSLFDKLSIRSRVGLVIYAIQKKLVVV